MQRAVAHRLMRPTVRHPTARADVAEAAGAAACAVTIHRTHRAVVGAARTLLGLLLTGKADRAVGFRERTGAGSILRQAVAGHAGAAHRAGGSRVTLDAGAGAAIGVDGARQIGLHPRCTV